MGTGLETKLREEQLNLEMAYWKFDGDQVHVFEGYQRGSRFRLFSDPKEQT